MNASASTGAVVVGVDRSRDSDRALEWAVVQADCEHRPLVIVHAAGQHPVTPGGTGQYPGDAERALVAAGDATAERAVSQALRLSRLLRLSVVMEVADPRTLLLDTARDASLLVVGSRGLGPISSLLIGSVSVAVTERASCPVVVVRPHVRQKRRGIVVGVDGSSASEAALEFAFAQASIHDQPLTAVHCVSPALARRLPLDTEGRYIAEAEDDEAIVLAESVAGLREKYVDVSADLKISHGSPVRHLLDEGDHAVLLVMGSRGRGGAKATLLGSVSRSVLERAECNVAIVRPH